MVIVWKKFRQALKLRRNIAFQRRTLHYFNQKKANGKKGSIVTIIKGTKADDVINILKKIPVERRNMVKEVTVDMAGNMNLIAKKCFPKTELVTD